MISTLLKQGWQPCQLSEDDHYLKTVGRFKLYGCCDEPFLIVIDTATNQTVGLDCSYLNQKEALKNATKILKTSISSHKQTSLL